LIASQGDAMPDTFAFSTSGGTAVPGVDYSPVPQTITLTPNPNTPPPVGEPSKAVSIPILPGPASLGTRVLEVSVPQSPSNPQQTTEYIVITHGTDTTSPYVVSSQALTQGGKVVAFSIQFSKPMAVSSVTNLANYVAAAPKSSLEVAGTMMSDGGLNQVDYTKNIPLKSAIYDAATDTVYLIPVKPEIPNKVAARFHIEFEVGSPPSTSFSNLVDTSGNPIASDNTYDNIGTLAQFSQVTKASPSTLAYLFGTPTQTKPTPKPKHGHKVK
jgi:hypothetical protein